MTGDSQSEYIKSFVNVARLRLGARCVVFNNRGRGGHVLKTARTYCASKTDDLAAVIDHIKAKNPNASLMALGVSLGKFLFGCWHTEGALFLNTVSLGNFFVSWHSEGALFTYTVTIPNTGHKILLLDILW